MTANDFSPTTVAAPLETHDSIQLNDKLGGPRIGHVPFVSLGRQHHSLREELADAFQRVVQTDGFILGDEVAAFEAEWADYCGTDECVGVSSGTAALRVGIESAGICEGEEVVVPAHTFYASAAAIVQAGATPVFCDVEDGTGLIDPAAAAAAITPRTGAIICVHLYGQMCDMEALRALSDRHGLLLIEDAAQAHGATWGSARAGSLGDVAAFSFYPSKNVGALGDAGAITTSRPDIADRARMLRNLGQRTKGHHDVLGGNDRLDGLQAAFLRAKIPHIDGWNSRRLRVAQRYRESLPPELRLLLEDTRGRPSYHLFPVRTAARDRLARALGERHIATGVHYSPALHQQPALRSYGRGQYPNAEAWAAEELSLPMFPELSRLEIEFVLAACREGVLEARTDRG
jgi:dTDP-3-amino-3,4,6-trideoxy-alpha-D-glucose transaminase